MGVTLGARLYSPHMVTHQPGQRKAPIVAQSPACSHQGAQDPLCQAWVPET